MDLVSLALAVGAGTLVYKILTTKFGPPDTVNIPENSEFFGNDKMTIQKGFLGADRLQPILYNEVDTGLSHASLGGALFEVSTDQVQDTQTQLPGHVAVGTYLL